MKFVSNRDTVIRSRNTGHAIEYKKGVPTETPVGMHSEVLEKGILPVEDSGKPVDPAENKATTEVRVLIPPEDGNEREAKILGVFPAIIKRNVSSDFAGGGCPSAGAVTAALGWRVEAKEVRAVWEKHRRELLNPEE